LVSRLQETEQDKMQQWQRKRDKVRKGITNKSNDGENEQEESWKIEYNKFQHLEYYHPEHPEFESKNHIFNRINYYDENWCEQYNNFYFKGDINGNNKIDYFSIKDVCEKYIKSLAFCLDYY
jgi:hypothetical protein